MGQVLNTLSLPFIEQRVEELNQSIKKRTEQPRPRAAKLRQILSKYNGSDVSIASAIESLNTENLMQLAALEHARGADPEDVRNLYRTAAAEWEPVIAAINFKLKVFDEEVGNLPSYAKELQRDFGARCCPAVS